MREFVGVRSQFAQSTSLKRELAVFTRIAILSLRERLNPTSFRIAHPDEGDSVVAVRNEIKELEWLSNEGHVFDPGVEADQSLLDDEEYKRLLDLEAKFRGDSEYITGELFSALEKCQVRRSEILRNIVRSREPISEYVGMSLYSSLEESLASQLNDVLYLVDEHSIRRISVQLRLVESLDAYPILSGAIRITQKENCAKQDVVRLVLNKLPVPDESVSWEQIIEYRSDPDSQSKFLALRHWMSEVARAELTPAEVEEKLEYLIDQYQQHMRLHRMKTNVGTLETVVTTGAEFLGDLVSFKWGKAAEALFSLRRRRVALLEGELTAPGNEVAYIVKARETFS